MQVEHLSDHVGQQLRSSQARMQGARTELETRQADLRQAKDQVRAARRAKPWWKILLFVPTPEQRSAVAYRQDVEQRIRRVHQEMEQIDQRIRQQTAGAQGENLLEQGLAHLPDEWVMLRGYRNRRGEADHVLVGPGGIWLVEVKYRRVRLHVRGDEWWYEKLDSYGNAVENGWATDRTGRSWGDQVNDVAQDLRSWLSRNHHDMPVYTAVMLMHHQAQLGQTLDLAVNLLGTAPRHLIEAIRESHASLTPAQRVEIVDLIRRDHLFHNKNAPQRRSGKKGARYRQR